ncbi:MAG: 16S rRNA (guanine(527)-N(7))-methyltransferase RsmG [Sphingomonadales bacterium]
MDEAEARAILAERFAVPRETFERIEGFLALLRRENERQNLVSRSTLDQLWARHVLDSAQLLAFVDDRQASWADLGSGAGFPGLIVGLLHPGPVTLIEQRRLRADFLERGAERLGISGKIHILCANAGQIELPPFDVISARAFAPLDRLLSLALHLSTPCTVWVLPKGRNAKSELDAARASWQGRFRLEPSLTDPDALIIVADQVERRRKGKRAR